MKSTTNILCFILLNILNSYSQNLIWATKSGTQNSEFNKSISVNTDGSVINIGNFSGTVDTDSGTNVFNLTSQGQNDIAITKLDSSGNLVWAKRVGGNYDDTSKSISIDNFGNIYVIGDFVGIVDFDSGLGVSNLTSFDLISTDIFILKLNSSGNFIWAKKMGGNDYEFSKSIFVDQNQNVYSTGIFFSELADFDPGLNVFNLNAVTGTCGTFILKLDVSGNLVWAKNFSGDYASQGTSITTDSSGNVYTVGEFRNVMDFNPNVSVFNMTSTSGSADIFISKLNSNGSFIWAKRIGDIFDDRATSIKLDYNGNVLTTGYFQNTVDFDPGLSIFNLVSQGGTKDVFVSKLDSTGAFVWAKKLGSGSEDIGYSIEVDNSNNVYTVGSFSGLNVDFDPSNNIFNLSGSSINTFISKLNSFGSFVWAKQFTGNSNRPSTIVLDNNDNIYVGGVFSSGSNILLGTVDFDPNITNFNLTTTGTGDNFIQKMNQQNLSIVNDLNENISFLITPNPSNSYIEIIKPYNDNSENYIEIINTTGTIILKSFKEKLINISNLSNGLYIIKIKNGNDFLTKKFIKN